MSIQSIRERYLTALAEGKSIKVATAIANGEEPPRKAVANLPPPPASPNPTMAIDDSGNDKDALDHDGDGKKGGSTAPEGDKADIAALRAEYTALNNGKRPFAGWDEEELAKRIEALKAKQA